MIRDYEMQQRSAAPPDFVDQIQARFRRHPFWAWVIVCFFLAAVLVGFAKNLLDLFERIGLLG